MGWFVTLLLNFLWNKVFGLISDWIKGLVARFKKNKEIEDASNTAAEKHDQRDLERVIGNGSHAGEISGEPGAVVQQDPPPNVGNPEA